MKTKIDRPSLDDLIENAGIEFSLNILRTSYQMTELGIEEMAMIDYPWVTLKKNFPKEPTENGNGR